MYYVKLNLAEIDQGKNDFANAKFAEIFSLI